MSDSKARALVVGGKRGFGAALAREAVGRGLDTTVYGRSRDDAEAVPGATARFLDLQSRSSVKAAQLLRAGEGPAYLLWVAGAWLKGELAATSDAEIDGMVDLLFRGPALLVRDVLKEEPWPLHLVTISSSSGWRQREREALYCGLKAAQAAFTRNLVPELRAAHPSNRVTLVNPGGLAVPTFHTGVPFDTAGMMDPDTVAGIVWDEVERQEGAFLELQILRDREPGREGTPIVSIGPRQPEEPE